MSLTSKKAPNWQRSAIHSAIALAFTNVVFVAPSAAIQDCIANVQYFHGADCNAKAVQ